MTNYFNEDDLDFGLVQSKFQWLTRRPAEEVSTAHAQSNFRGKYRKISLKAHLLYLKASL